MSRYYAQNKYHAKKTKIGDRVFDSRHEAECYAALKRREDNGEIQDLQCQVRFELIPLQRINGKTLRSATYIADFTYTENGEKVVADAKGVKTDVYQLKKKLMVQKYGILVKEL